MTSRNACAVALITGWAGYAALMMVHPTRLGGPAIGHVSLNDAVHWTGLLLLPVLMYAYIELGRRLDLRRPLVLLAVCTLIASLFAGMAAATMSGLVMAEVAGDEFPPETLHALRDLVFWLNQGFGTVHYVLLMIGIGLFALAWPNRPSDLGLKWGGVLAALGFMAWLATGSWGADVHSVLVVVIVAGVWSIAAAVAQRSLPDEG